MELGEVHSVLGGHPPTLSGGEETEGHQATSRVKNAGMVLKEGRNAGSGHCPRQHVDDLQKTAAR